MLHLVSANLVLVKKLVLACLNPLEALAERTAQI
jgi:hypothetical protein